MPEDGELNIMTARAILVTGAGGFIGGHLVADLRRQGHAVRAVDCVVVAVAAKPLREDFVAE